MNEELKHLFITCPMVSFRSSRKIGSYLVRTKLYPVESSVGSFDCKRPPYQICAYVNGTNSFSIRLQEKLIKLIIDFTTKGFA